MVEIIVEVCNDFSICTKTNNIRHKRKKKSKHLNIIKLIQTEVLSEKQQGVNNQQSIRFVGLKRNLQVNAQVTNNTLVIFIKNW